MADIYGFLTVRTSSSVAISPADAGAIMVNGNKVPTLNEAFDASRSNCRRYMESWFMMQ